MSTGEHWKKMPPLDVFRNERWDRSGEELVFFCSFFFFCGLWVFAAAALLFSYYCCLNVQHKMEEERKKNQPKINARTTRIILAKMSGQRSNRRTECSNEAIWNLIDEWRTTPLFEPAPVSGSKPAGEQSLNTESCRGMNPCCAFGVASPNLERKRDSDKIASAFKHSTMASTSE